MRNHKQALTFSVGVALIIGALTACGGEHPPSTGAPTTGTPATSEEANPRAEPLPQSATYVARIADERDDGDLYLIVNIEGDGVVAYACNNADDSAWFFGTQRDGVIDLSSPWLDTLTASFDGTNLTGSLTMNEPDAAPLSFVASPGTEAAGIYTATDGDARASWVVVDSDLIYGVLQPNSRRDRELIKKITAQQNQFRNQVRQARLRLQKQQAPRLNLANRTTMINGTTVRAFQVTARMRSLPTSR